MSAREFEPETALGSPGDSTEDALLGGRLTIRQPRRGYRVNIDTLLLAAAIQTPGARIAEPCCGGGAALLGVAARHTGETHDFVGIECDPLYAALARENVARNGQAGRVTIVEADALDPNIDLGVFDCVLLNPPYDQPGEGRAPAEGKRGAFISDRPIGDWVKLWCNRMSAQATLTLIHRASKLDEILAALDGRLGGVDIFPIRPTANAPASRVIVRAKKGSRAPLKLFAGLDLHPADASEKYTEEADAILRGDKSIAFG